MGLVVEVDSEDAGMLDGGWTSRWTPAGPWIALGTLSGSRTRTITSYTCNGGTCDPSTSTDTGSCSRSASETDGTPCPDGSFCDGTEVCSGGTCTGGTSPCGGSLMCVESTDMCVECTSASHCSDGNPCTSDSCSSGSCVNPATSGSCSTCASGFCECSAGSCVDRPQPTVTVRIERDNGNSAARMVGTCDDNGMSCTVNGLSGSDPDSFRECMFTCPEGSTVRFCCSDDSNCVDVGSGGTPPGRSSISGVSVTGAASCGATMSTSRPDSRITKRRTCVVGTGPITASCETSD
ncbi:MAG TPA: hypothetical protein RMH99_02590 [Sandaracinaceae bacterium LLY-WYZ-13_1]|nr:hypothetical protein [Sandaracinaceae bacterium LLY-WYZ-13_1]